MPDGFQVSTQASDLGQVVDGLPLSPALSLRVPVQRMSWGAVATSAWWEVKQHGPRQVITAPASPRRHGLTTAPQGFWGAKR